MNTDILSVDEIKGIRKAYGLSQRSFAQLLGIGEASIVRYEKGSIPSKANANLIRAAKNPRFMLECLERDGGNISASQRAKAEEYIYAAVSLEGDTAEEESMEVNELYGYVLQQEALNEQAANIANDVMRYMNWKGILPSDKENPISLLLDNLFALKRLIISEESRDDSVLDQIRGYLKYTEEYVSTITELQKAG